MAASFEATSVKTNTYKKDVSPLHYNHKFASMKAFSQHLVLKDVRLRTLQSYYRQMRLVSEHFRRDPKGLSQKSIRSYILHLKEGKGWCPSSIRQGIAACRMFYCEMLGKQWKLWDVVKVRDIKRLPVVLEIEQVADALRRVSLLRHRTPLRLIYCCGLRLDECVRLTVDDVEPNRLTVRDGKGGKDRFIPLSSVMYQKLRYYWKQHRNPKFIFPTPGRGLCTDARERMRRSELPIGKGSLQKAFHEARLAAGIRKKAEYPHLAPQLRNTPSRHGGEHSTVATVSGP